MRGSAARMPQASVVIPTFNRAELLPVLVEALTTQEGISDYELLFVDDQSTDATFRTLAELAGASPVPIRVLRTETDNRGPAVARNLGWRAARGRVIAFTDDDCVPQPGWLAALVRGLASADLVQGLTEVDPREIPIGGAFARFIVITEFSWKFETCNVGYRDELLQRLGGFDESFEVPLGEDVDLGWRAVDAGARAEWCPDAIVFHRVERSDSRFADWINWVRYVQRCQWLALVVKRHPAWRDHLFARWFYTPYHAYTIGAIAALGLVPRSRRMAVVSAAPWLVYRVVVQPRPARLRWLWATLPMAFAVDVAEVAATIRGAIRFRTFLL